MKLLTKMVGLTLAVSFAACGEPADEPTGEPDAITKDEARELGGKSDGIDWCDYLGWYGDGICDDFCAEPDPDCAPETCDDGSSLHPLCDMVPACADGTEPAIINGCFECVDPDTCEAPEPPDPEGQLCGGIAGLLCPDGYSCQMDAGMCNVADAAGTCVQTGNVCPAVYDPVCGCDGNTYSNACAATSVGASVDHDGECLPPDAGGDCGGIAGLTCAAGEFCAYAPDAMCGAADQMGTCTPRPEACITLYDPVCGCDGNTYSNSCFAASSGASVASDGECAP